MTPAEKLARLGIVAKALRDRDLARLAAIAAEKGDHEAAITDIDRNRARASETIAAAADIAALTAGDSYLALLRSQKAFQNIVLSQTLARWHDARALAAKSLARTEALDSLARKSSTRKPGS
jgi:uncharacterized protein YdbL (DUF1318 family)